MAASILIQDILAICVLLSDGDIELSLEEIICRAEEFQEKNNRHFGTTKNDFRGLFYYLIYFELKLKDEICNGLNDIRIKDVINEILGYHDTYFNDEGEYWFS